MAGAAQAGENLSIGERGKKLIALNSRVLGRCLGVDGVHVQPCTANGENVVGDGAAVWSGREVDVDLGSSQLTGSGGRVRPGLALRARHRRQLVLLDHRNSVSQLRVLDGGKRAEQERPR